MMPPPNNDEDIDLFLNVYDNLKNRKWLDVGIGVGVWIFLGLLLLVGSPFAAGLALYSYSKKILLKFRRWAADKIRPKDVVRARNPEPQSDIVAQFVEYEWSLVSGKETIEARVALISVLAHVEQELEEHRILSAEIRKLRVEDERPRRRDAILSTRIRAERRRERERDEGTK